jgi:hypothetical protein
VEKKKAQRDGEVIKEGESVKEKILKEFQCGCRSWVSEEGIHYIQICKAHSRDKERAKELVKA